MRAYPELRYTRLIRDAVDAPEGPALDKLRNQINDKYEKVYGTKNVFTWKTFQKLKKGDPSLGLTNEMQLALREYWPHTKHLPPFIVPGIYEILPAKQKVTFML